MDSYNLPEEGTLRYKLKQFNWHCAGLFPDVPEGDLWAAVLMQAVEDAAGYTQGQLNKYHDAEARYYLQQPVIPACAVCSVDSDYIRQMLDVFGLEI